MEILQNLVHKPFGPLMGRVHDASEYCQPHDDMEKTQKKRIDIAMPNMIVIIRIILDLPTDLSCEPTDKSGHRTWVGEDQSSEFVQLAHRELVKLSAPSFESYRVTFDEQSKQNDYGKEKENESYALVCVPRGTLVLMRLDRNRLFIWTLFDNTWTKNEP